MASHGAKLRTFTPQGLAGGKHCYTAHCLHSAEFEHPTGSRKVLSLTAADVWMMHAQPTSDE
eukprot:5899808-Amphidinium_carterae.1